MTKNSIVFIGQSELQPYIDSITEEIENVIPDTSIHTFSNPKEGLEYILANLKTRMIVIAPCRFKGKKITGLDIYKEIRKHNALVNVILICTSNHKFKTIDEVSTLLREDKHAVLEYNSFLPVELRIFKVRHILTTIRNRWEKTFDYAFEDMIYTRPEIWSKRAYSDPERELTWGDVLEIVRKQPVRFKNLEMLVDTCIRKYRELKERDPKTSFPIVIKIPIVEKED